MATVESPYSRPQLHLRTSSDRKFPVMADRILAGQKPLAQPLPSTPQVDHHQSTLYGSYDTHQQHSTFPPQQQQAWQAPYQGMVIAHSPSFEETRSSTPLEAQYAGNRLRTSSGTSSSSANVPPAAVVAQPYHPYRRQPGNMKRSRSSDGDLSAGARAAGSVPASTVVPLDIPVESRRPSGTVIQTPRTAEQYRERPRVESNESTDSRSSVIEHANVGMTVRTGRIPVPRLTSEMEEMQSAQWQTQRSVSTPVSTTKSTIGGEADARSAGNQTSKTAFDATHKRQSSSTSSVGAMVHPTLNQSGISSFNAGNSVSTPPQVIATSPAKIPLAPVISPERPTRTLNVKPSSMSPGKAESSSGSGGLKGRLQRALNKSSDKDKTTGLIISSPIGEPRQSGLTPLRSAPAGLPGLPPPSTRSVSNPQQTQSQSGSQPHPGLGYRRPSNSSFAPSFIEPLNGNAGKGKRNLFSMRNASTDNISIGSTVSSASMMIRKMGALGKLARRNSMAGISRIFKNRDDEDGVIVPEPKMEDHAFAAGKPKKDKKKKKSLFGGSRSQSADSTSNFASADAAAADGQIAEDLTPAAKLARQHTLRTKTEEARKAAAAARANRQMPPAAAYGDESTVQRQRSEHSVDDVDAVDAVAAQLSQFSLQGEDSQNVPTENDQYGDAPEVLEDRTGVYDEDEVSVYGDMSEDDGEYVWGRSYRDRHAVPVRGILKRAATHDSISRLGPPPQWPRPRAKSSENADRQEPGPLSKLPSQDPDSVDGRIDRNASAYDPFSQSFSPFESNIDREPLADRLNFPYSNPGMNSSAPVLAGMTLDSRPGAKPQRSVTSPPVEKRNINWAPECAIYHTFHAEVYDRRSEPATCNRLTPQLAQQIKDELNGFKLEEMDVHPASRINTHFFV